jgi:hypothetical protein
MKTRRGWKQQSLHQRRRRCNDTLQSSTNMDGTGCWERRDRPAGSTIRADCSAGKVIWHVVRFEDTRLTF